MLLIQRFSLAKFSLVGVLLAASVALAAAQGVVYQATDQSFSVQLPAGFGPADSPPANTLLAVEVPNSGMSLFCTKGEAVELEQEVFAEKMKQNLFDGGAQIHGKARASLAGKPASSFLVGGVARGKESLFVFNQREDAVYTFVFNYPEGQREKAAGMWNKIAPTFKFRQPKK